MQLVEHKDWLILRLDGPTILDGLDVSIMVVRNVNYCAEAFLQIWRFMHARPQSLVKYLSFIMTLILEGICDNSTTKAS